jgi:hypothetical protein
VPLLQLKVSMASKRRCRRQQRADGIPASERYKICEGDALRVLQVPTVEAVYNYCSVYMQICCSGCVPGAAQVDADICCDDVVSDDWMRAKKQGRRSKGTPGTINAEAWAATQPCDACERIKGQSAGTEVYNEFCVSSFQAHKHKMIFRLGQR